MTTTFTSTIDRANWPRGPWDNEPDRIEWRTEAGFPALVTRQDTGHLCGYVAVPPGHPCHGRTDLDLSGLDGAWSTLSVHGGITYASACHGHVCHVPEPGEPDDVWWLGFDAGHCDDTCPQRMMYGLGGEYRDVPFMRAECEALAKQLVALVAP